MCENCTPFKTAKFSSYQEFATFEKTLDAKCEDGTFIRVVTADDTENATFIDTYECTTCGEDWVLAAPEHFSHGSFLPNENGIVLYENNETSESYQTNSGSTFKTFQAKSKSGCGCCLGMIFLIILVIIYLVDAIVSFVF